MTIMASVGRPRKEGLDKIIKTTVNNQTAQKLDDAVKTSGKSKSDILRELIPIVSSKSFEELIPNISMEVLQSYSEQAWNLLHTPGCTFEINNISDIMPAYIVNQDSPMIHVKFPTYKIEIFNGEDPKSSTNQQHLEEILSCVKNRSKVVASRVDFLIINDKIEPMKYPFVNEVMCLETSMEKNISCKNQIISLLKEKGYRTSVYPAYCIRGAYIVFSEDNKHFKLK